MSAATIDYDALAKQSGAVVDYDSLAAQHGGQPQHDFSSLTANPKGEGTYKIKTGDGQTIDVPYSNVPVFTKNLQGTSFASPEEESRFTKDAANDPHRPTYWNVLTNPIGAGAQQGVGQGALQVGGQAINAMAQPFAHPIDTLANTAKTLGWVARNIDNPLGGAADESGNPITPIVQKFAADKSEGGTPLALENLAGNLIGGVEGGRLAGASITGVKPSAALANSPIAGDLNRFIPEAVENGAIPSAAKKLASSKNVTIGGQNFTPAQLNAHAAVLAEGNPGATPGYVPQRQAMSTGSILRDTAALHPELTAKIFGDDPVANLEAEIGLRKAAQLRIDQAHRSILQQVGEHPVDTAAIQRAVLPTAAQMQGIDPAELPVISGLIGRARNVSTLDGLNEFRQFMNAEDLSLRGNPSYAKSIGMPQMVHRMANAARDSYYAQLEGASGLDLSDMKNMEGSLIQQTNALTSAKPRLTSADAKFDAPFDTRKALGDIVEGATRTGQPGVPVIGGIATKAGELLRGSKLDQLQRLSRKFYADLPEQPTVQLPTQLAPGYPKLVMPQSNPAVARGNLLPERSGGAYVTPYDPGMTGGERIAALMQLLRRNPQLALPAKASPIITPPPQ